MQLRERLRAVAKEYNEAIEKGKAREATQGSRAQP